VSSCFIKKLEDDDDDDDDDVTNDGESSVSDGEAWNTQHNCMK